jgi:CRISPR-associated endonuclease/helicase Cas3
MNGFATVHHGRLGAADRRLLDEAVQRAIGRTGRGEGGRVIVGTQTLEQSLDQTAGCRRR